MIDKVKDRAIVSGGLSVALGGIITMFLYDMVVGFIIAIIGVIIGFAGALLFRQS